MGTAHGCLPCFDFARQLKLQPPLLPAAACTCCCRCCQCHVCALQVPDVKLPEVKLPGLGEFKASSAGTCCVPHRWWCSLSIRTPQAGQPHHHQGLAW